MPQPDRNILEAALLGLEAQASRINQQIADVRSRLGGGRRGRPATENATAAPARGRRELSPEARKRIAEAQAKRWAAFRAKRAEQGSPAPAAKKKAGRRKKQAQPSTE